MSPQRIIIWYRNDLRIHDHEPLWTVAKAGAIAIPIYCFDPRQFATTKYGFAKTGAFRAQFLTESVLDLRDRLRQLGSDLIVRYGEPEQILPELAQKLNANANAIYYHQEVTSEETKVEAAIAQDLAATDIKLQAFWGHTLYHRDDLPFSMERIPAIFTKFRKQVEQEATINPALPMPTELISFNDLNDLNEIDAPLDPGEIPSLAQLGLEPIAPDDRAAITFTGGEGAAIARLDQYFWQNDCLRTYKQTRNGMLGADYSSKFSPWLAHGCISPRYIFEQVQKYEQDRVANDSTYWLVFELIWRDYFRFIAAKHGDRLFYKSGLQNLDLPWKKDSTRFAQWCEGKTGFPLIDANMRELAATGFMSNRGRQNVASFLTKNLGIDWRIGAAWFESLLIDYDVCSNWGNWNYSAGVGNDARGFRFFNTTKQARDYDRQGDYAKHWLPELAKIPASKVHEPWLLSPAEQKQYGVRLGVDYPQPIVDLFKSAQANQKLYEMALSHQ
ncbi:deoxyribodipyrimidine photo-lyase (single-stranded DNA-specific) [Thalassoporum mexicanum PCC 7367]|uniref:DASH family cryptochrome n=1 Tax=Thalassoporum mexicanum TaxID=3457544 RepID=UPI00029FCFD0|nr:DASH family cryptochrome [Pseudanabaena sp. PCC 7367]AFY70021.1 deoxyribodipyrimidine photo-lyase (single-stranded DNA-specific) [Pseudanabaena sp. PCC 7367]